MRSTAKEQNAAALLKEQGAYRNGKKQETWHYCAEDGDLEKTIA